MPRAIDVASYILNEQGRLSGHRLQRLLYYRQAWCLVTQDRPLFLGTFEPGNMDPWSMKSPAHIVVGGR